MNKRGVIHFSAAPDISLLSTSKLVDTKIFCVVVILAPVVMFEVKGVMVGVMLAAARMLAMVLMLEIPMHLVRLGMAPR